MELPQNTTLLSLQGNIGWQVVLLVDSREPFADQIVDTLRQTSSGAPQFELLAERRALKVFDYVWLARRRGNAAEEIVLGHGVERKTVQDLSCSLDRVKGSTGLSRFLLQKLKMDILHAKQSFTSLKG
jgi:ERCC4-type nuclease